VPGQSIPLSLVIPAYNEAARLPSYLTSVRPYLEQRYGYNYEVIVVDDGSRDNLAGFLERLGFDWPQLRCLRHPVNRGKGAAVRTGMLAAQGELLLFTDADGATPIDEEARLAAAIHSGADVAVGSRLLPDPSRQRSRPWLRGLAGRVFAALARALFHVRVQDTQCGFKMFRSAAGRALFSLLEEPGYLFDVEVLVRSQRLGYRLAEVPIRWTEITGGQFRLMREIPRTILALLRLRRRLGLATRRRSV
jgi:dolichyl-phosphate beta-glucosyltransferase